MDPSPVSDITGCSTVENNVASGHTEPDHRPPRPSSPQCASIPERLANGNQPCCDSVNGSLVAARPTVIEPISPIEYHLAPVHVADSDAVTEDSLVLYRDGPSSDPHPYNLDCRILYPGLNIDHNLETPGNVYDIAMSDASESDSSEVARSRGNRSSSANGSSTEADSTTASNTSLCSISPDVLQWQHRGPHSESAPSGSDCSGQQSNSAHEALSEGACANPQQEPSSERLDVRLVLQRLGCGNSSDSCSRYRKLYEVSRVLDLNKLLRDRHESDQHLRLISITKYEYVELLLFNLQLERFGPSRHNFYQQHIPHHREPQQQELQRQYFEDRPGHIETVLLELLQEHYERNNGRTPTGQLPGMQSFPDAAYKIRFECEELVTSVLLRERYPRGEETPCHPQQQQWQQQALQQYFLDTQQQAGFHFSQDSQFHHRHAYDRHQRAERFNLRQNVQLSTQQMLHFQHQQHLPQTFPNYNDVYRQQQGQLEQPQQFEGQQQPQNTHYQQQQLPPPQQQPQQPERSGQYYQYPQFQRR